jgi:hypothetical protein
MKRPERAYMTSQAKEKYTVEFKENAVEPLSALMLREKGNRGCIAV